MWKQIIPLNSSFDEEESVMRNKTCFFKYKQTYEKINSSLYKESLIISN